MIRLVNLLMVSLVVLVVVPLLVYFASVKAISFRWFAAYICRNLGIMFQRPGRQQILHLHRKFLPTLLPLLLIHLQYTIRNLFPMRLFHKIRLQLFQALPSLNIAQTVVVTLVDRLDERLINSLNCFAIPVLIYNLTSSYKKRYVYFY